MSYEERATWVSTIVTVLVTGIYCVSVLNQLGSVPLAQIAYQKPMLMAIGAIIIVTIIGMILMSIGSAVAAEIKHSGSVDDIGRKDERDDHINRRGELVGYYVASVGIIGVIALAMLRADQFWIANALFLTLMIGGLTSSVVKIVIYRRGY
jgi:hypothetical protein